MTCDYIFAQISPTAVQIDRELESKYKLAQILERQGRLEQAKELYKYVFNRKPDNYVYYNQYVNILFKQEDFEELEIAINEFLKIHPDNINAVIDLGEMYLARGDTSMAFQHWNNAIEKFNHSPAFYRVLFNSMANIGLFEEAENLMIKAREFHNNNNLFSVDLANYYMHRGEYTKSAQEYLAYARSNPKNFNFISGQILRFPREEEVFSSIDSLILNEINKQKLNPDLHRLRAELLFKHNRYNDAIEEAFLVESLTGNKGAEVLKLADDLVKVKEYGFAKDLYSKILQSADFTNVAPQALLGLANVVEKSVLDERAVSPFKYFYTDNIFFNADLIYNVGLEVENLKQAFAIYDSLIITMPRSIYSAEAYYRLAELRYRVTHDFDGALNFYTRTYKSSTNIHLRNAALLRISEVEIARGDPAAALDLLQHELTKHEGTEFEKDFRVYFLLAKYLAGEIDSLDIEVNDVIPLLGPDYTFFNDVMEFINFVEENYSNANEKGKEAFKDFVKGELFLRQNKLSEAEEVYNYLIINYPDVPISSSARFRLSQIQLYFGENEAAIETIIPILDARNDLADNSAFMMAEMSYFVENDIDSATFWYEMILEKYPSSLYTDIARKRLREFQRITG
jgi:tetratricopeptide (TPR) repeat protein